MNMLQFGDGACEKVRRYLDSYLDSELLVETNHEVLRHLEGCAACSRELESRAFLKSRLRQAVMLGSAPPGFEASVIATLRGYQPDRRRNWMLAIAAIVLLSIGTWSIQRQGTSGSELLASIMQTGLDDHVHCALQRSYAEPPPSLPQMESDMGPVFREMIPVVRGKVPAEYRLEQAHLCTYKTRQYTHMIFRNDSALISVIVTRKGAGESFGRKAGLRQSDQGQFAIAATETPDYLVFVISNLSSKQNLQMAANVTPDVASYLKSHSGV